MVKKKKKTAEGTEDIKAIKEREKETSISYDEIVKRLKKDGLI